MSASDRRPIALRANAQIQGLARWLARRGATPNQVSLASVLLAAAGGAALALSGRVEESAPLYLFAALMIELRLLANMLDGLIAIEGGQQTPAGALYNDVPDRFADALFLVGAGYGAGGAWGVALGWLGALLAALTAYVRALGASLGLPSDFSGPMAKPHRMHLLAAGCVIAAVGSFVGADRGILLATLAIIAAGTALTVALRLRRVAQALEDRAQ
ncbi:MAG: CDP-alcohol phosphatidyltransferase family protein [Alphaproteobacteria bacterium]